MTTYEKLSKNGIFLNPDDVERICKKYNISELSVFGSSLRGDFDDDSDLDILISFLDVWQNDPFDILHIEDEFKMLLNRQVDIVCKEGLKNPIRKKNILTHREVIYAYQC